MYSFSDGSLSTISAIGIGGKYGNYTNKNGTLFTNYSITADLMTKINIIPNPTPANTSTVGGLGFLLAGGRTLVLGQEFILGGAYIGQNGLKNGKGYAVWGVNITF
jgi:hypothetical protein